MLLFCRVISSFVNSTCTDCWVEENPKTLTSAFSFPNLIQSLQSCLTCQQLTLNVSAYLERKNKGGGGWNRRQNIAFQKKYYSHYFHKHTVPNSEPKSPLKKSWVTYNYVFVYAHRKWWGQAEWEDSLAPEFYKATYASGVWVLWISIILLSLFNKTLCVFQMEFINKMN